MSYSLTVLQNVCKRNQQTRKHSLRKVSVIYQGAFIIHQTYLQFHQKHIENMKYIQFKYSSYDRNVATLIDTIQLRQKIGYVL
jgi:hypothetical protein